MCHNHFFREVIKRQLSKHPTTKEGEDRQILQKSIFVFHVVVATASKSSFLSSNRFYGAHNNSIVQHCWPVVLSSGITCHPSWTSGEETPRECLLWLSLVRILIDHAGSWMWYFIVEKLATFKDRKALQVRPARRSLGHNINRSVIEKRRHFEIESCTVSLFERLVAVSGRASFVNYSNVWLHLPATRRK